MAIGWQHTQNDEYLQLIKHRIANIDLTWASQFIDIIKEKYAKTDSPTVKDIGCQSFQFYKQIKKQNLSYQYYGYEIEEKYVTIGLEHFPELKNNVIIGDFLSLNDVKVTDITVCSAIVEHVDSWPLFLCKILDSSRSLSIFRTFLGEITRRDCVKQQNAKAEYPIWQFGFEDFLNVFTKKGWDTQIRRDMFTESFPVCKIYGHRPLVRTQYVIVADKR